MGMMFTYNLTHCKDYRNCHLESGLITQEDPWHWHLIGYEGGDWTSKTRVGCLMRLVTRVNQQYDRLYDDKGEHRG